VDCLIAAINAANSQPQKPHTIRLEAGVYALAEVDNTADGRNALPSVAGRLTIRGAGVERTILDCVAFDLRLLHIGQGGQLRLEGLTLRNGSAGVGGGVFNGGSVTIRRATITGGRSVIGGGLYNRGGWVTLEDSAIVDNIARFVGGALYSADGVVVIRRSTVADNAAAFGTGGVFVWGGAVAIVQSAFVGNAGEAGGLTNVDGFIDIVNSTFGSNRGSRGAGALHNVSGSLRILNSTIADNVGFTGGLLNRGTVWLKNAILAENRQEPPPGPPRGPNCDGAVTSLGHNLFGDLSRCAVVLQPTDRLGEPGLGEFVDDGTPGNGHFPLLPTSPAIDAGDDAACPKRDQLQRRRDRPCDIGAVEFQGEEPARVSRSD
jgi:hypothetical protein